jgi:hypothetical protein
LRANGELFDLKDAPFTEIPVDRDTTDEGAKESRKTLQAVLDDHKAAPVNKDALTPAQKKKRAERRKAAKAA